MKWRSLVDDGVLGARSFDGLQLVVRSDDIERLTEVFAAPIAIPGAPPIWRRDRPRPALLKDPPCTRTSS